MKIKQLIIPLLAVLTSCGKKSDTQMTPEQYQNLVDESIDYLQSKIDWCQSEFNLGTYERYDWNQETGELIWSDAGVPKVIAKVQFVGSISTKSNTWLWSWENQTILDEMKNDMLKVRDFGETNKIKKLIEAKWSAEEVDGWEMTSIAAKYLSAKGAYRSPDSDGFTFMIFTDISYAE